MEGIMAKRSKARIIKGLPSSESEAVWGLLRGWQP